MYIIYIIYISSYDYIWLYIYIIHNIYTSIYVFIHTNIHASSLTHPLPHPNTQTHRQTTQVCTTLDLTHSYIYIIHNIYTSIYVFRHTNIHASSLTPPPYVQILISLTVDTTNLHVWHMTFACRISEKGPIKLRYFRNAATHCNTLQHTATHCDTWPHEKNPIKLGSFRKWDHNLSKGYWDSLPRPVPQVKSAREHTMATHKKC